MIEMIVVIVLAAIVVGFVGMFMTAPMNAYLSQTRRADFTDSSTRLVRTISNDVSAALPNSVVLKKVGNDVFITVLHTLASSTYKTVVNGGEELTIKAAPDAAFTAMGALVAPNPPFAPLILNPPFLVVGNLGTPGNDAYQPGSVITNNVVVVNPLSPPAPAEEPQIAINAPVGFSFQVASPSNRVYAVDGPISYWCSPTTRTFTRYAGHSIAAVAGNPTTPALWAGAISSVLASNVQICAARFDSVTLATAGRGVGGLLSLTVTLNKPATAADSGETFTVFQQLRIEGEL